MNENIDANTPREGSKAATLLEMLRRNEGATLEEMTERTGWQPHTVRASMTGLRKKGHGIGKRAVGNATALFMGAAHRVGAALRLYGAASLPRTAKLLHRTFARRVPIRHVHA